MYFQTLSKGQIKFHEKCNFDAVGFKAAAGDAGDDHHNADSH